MIISGVSACTGPANSESRCMSKETPKLILFVEDDDNDVILVRHAFEKAGLDHELVIIEDSRSAIDYLGGHPRFSQQAGYRLPDLVVLDLKLVGSSGFDVLTWIGSRPELRGIRTVVFSSSWVDADVQKARQLGASEYIVKPGGFDGLVDWGRELHDKYLS